MGYFGGSALSDIKFGSSAVSKVYRGSSLMWQAVQLANGTLFHFGEAADSTDFANKGDQRGGGYSDGNSKVSNLQAKFGATSFFSDKANSGKGYLRASSIPDLAASDFTIDFWMRGDGVSPIDAGPWYLTSRNEFDTQNAWGVGYFNGIRFNYSTDGSQGTTVTFTNGSWTFPADTWMHVAIVREGNTLRCFLDGVEASQTGDMTGVTIYKTPSPLRLGHSKSFGSESSFFDGYLDEIRIILEASYTTSFTPPTAEYADWVDPFTGVTTSFEPGELQFAGPTTGETPAVTTAQAQEDEYSWETKPQNGANAGSGERINTGLDMTKRYDCYSIWTWANQDLIDTTGNYRMIIAGTLDDGVLGDGWCLYTRATGYGMLHSGSNFVPGIGSANLSTLAANTWHHHYLQIDWGSDNPDKTQRSNFNISIWTNGTAVATNYAVPAPFPETFGQNNGLDAWQLSQGVSPGGGGNTRAYYYDKLIAHTADTAPLTPGTNYTTAEIETALLAF